MRQMFIPLVLATLMFAACTKVSVQTVNEDLGNEVFTMSWRSAEPDMDGIITASVWDDVPVQTSFSAPWSDDKRDETDFRCYLSPHYLYFRFCVPDQSLTLQEPFLKKLDVGNEDRAEIFLSATPGMETYYSMEIDPAGRVLDYVTHYYRQYDYDWGFHSLQLATKVGEAEYIVAGRLSTAEMLQLGISLDEFYMGVFRADFNGPKNVVWYSLLRVEREKADFHIPEMLYKVVVEKPQTTLP